MNKKVNRKKKAPNRRPAYEKHPKSYRGYPFITLIEFRDTHLLVIVDNISNKMLRAYVIDLCGCSKVDEEWLIKTANEWYKSNRAVPLSIYISGKQLTPEFQSVYRDFPLLEITRIIGPVFDYDMDTIHFIKKRQRKVPGELVVVVLPVNWTQCNLLTE